jgi:transposase-like protein
LLTKLSTDGTGLSAVVALSMARADYLRRYAWQLWMRAIVLSVSKKPATAHRLHRSCDQGSCRYPGSAASFTYSTTHRTMSPSSTSECRYRVRFARSSIRLVSVRTTNGLERLNKDIKRRTQVVPLTPIKPNAQCTNYGQFGSPAFTRCSLCFVRCEVGRYG